MHNVAEMLPTTLGPVGATSDHRPPGLSFSLEKETTYNSNCSSSNPLCVKKETKRGGLLRETLGLSPFTKEWYIVGLSGRKIAQLLRKPPKLFLKNR